MPSTCPLMISFSPLAATEKTWNLTLDEPALTTRIESMRAQASGRLAMRRRASAYSTATAQEAMRVREARLCRHQGAPQIAGAICSRYWPACT